MSFEIFTDINNPKLKSIWQSLSKESCSFPQNDWEWCSSWWNNAGSKKNIKIYVLYDENNIPVAVAPFIIDSFFGIRFLRSMPENYGDYFDFVILPDVDSNACYAAVLNQIRKDQEVCGVLLFNVNSRSGLSKYLESLEYSVVSKDLVKTIVTEFTSVTYDEYLQGLSKNRRGYIRKKQRALESKFNIEVIFSKSVDVYLSAFDETFAIQRIRWDSTRPSRSVEYIKAVKDSNSALFTNGSMAFLGIRADGKLISYRIGLIHKNCFYDWNTSYDPAFEEYSPGAISIAYLVQKLIDNGIDKLDFMAGFYDYKLSYSLNPMVFDNKLYILVGNSFKGKLISWYFLHGRDIAKRAYARIRASRLMQWFQS